VTAVAPFKRKLIEVALPHDAINAGSAREKSIRHGHPSTLHLWWARRPLAAARAVIFAQMVDDPSAHPDLFPTEKKQEMEKTKGVGAVSHPPQLRATILDLSPWRRSLKERSDPSTGPRGHPGRSSRCYTSRRRGALSLLGVAARARGRRRTTGVIGAGGQRRSIPALHNSQPDH